MVVFLQTNNKPSESSQQTPSRFSKNPAFTSPSGNRPDPDPDDDPDPDQYPDQKNPPTFSTPVKDIRANF
jgi:hypothetical protein